MVTDTRILIMSCNLSHGTTLGILNETFEETNYEVGIVSLNDTVRVCIGNRCMYYFPAYYVKTPHCNYPPPLPSMGIHPVNYVLIR